MLSPRAAVRALLVITAYALASGCSVIDGSTDETLAPIGSAPGSTTEVTDTSTDPTIEVASTFAETVAPTTTIPSATVGPFPTQVPAGKCTPQAIRADFGTAPEAWLECAGAWAVTRIQSCPPDVECEGVDVFRWTNDGWRHRGMTYSLCVLMVDETGMPRSVNDRLLGGNTDCVEPITYTNESSSGPLQVGSRGDRTRRLQRRLVEWTLLNDSVDGYFGANTRNAVFDVQHLAGLQPTGVVDEPTARALGLPWP